MLFCQNLRRAAAPSTRRRLQISLCAHQNSLVNQDYRMIGQSCRGEHGILQIKVNDLRKLANQQ